MFILLPIKQIQITKHKFENEDMFFSYLFILLYILYYRNSTEKGRYVVANTKVNKGDALFVEKPFALIILPDQTYKHCHHCCKIFNAPVP